VESVSFPLSTAPRPRDFLRASGPDAEDFLQRMLSNDVAALEPGAACDALLLTPKARVIAPVRVIRRAADDYLLLTEVGLGETLRSHLMRTRFAAKVEIEPEEHTACVLLGDEAQPPDGLLAVRIDDYGVPAFEVVDGEPDGAEPLSEHALEGFRIAARTPAWGRELDDRVLPAEAGLVERAVSLTKGCYPGQEPIARLHYRGHANRTLRVLGIEGEQVPEYDAEIRLGEKVVGRVTSAVSRPGDGGVAALGYVRAEVPEGAPLTVDGRPTRLH
jgi:folate-binding protein YgfZ